MTYRFIVDTYETERIKVLSVWSMFKDEELPARPHPEDARGRSINEQMVHQCVSEDFWFKKNPGCRCRGSTASRDRDPNRVHA